MRRTPALAGRPAIDSLIRAIHGERVILDSDLASIYGIPTFRLNEAVKRNRERFPEDFMFQLTAQETASLTSQIAMSKKGRGGRRTRPYAFTEQMKRVSPLRLQRFDARKLRN
jgi:ORF6N domain